MVQLHKVHGSQNHFFLLDQTELATELSDPELVTLAQQMTNPQTGILNGADGLLVVNRSEHSNVLGQMRVINADGSEASMCGNGLRTVARYLADKHHLDDFRVETLTADLQVSRQPDLAKDVPAFSVEISPVRFNQAALPFDNLGVSQLIDTPVSAFIPGLTFSAIAVPNPHLISFVPEEELTNGDIGTLGTMLNSPNDYFPDGVNVNFAHILGPNQLFVRTFERGVGFTNACGTGMSATSLAFVLTHPELAAAEQPITVYNPGGMVKTIVHHHTDRDWIDLIGNATETHVIEVNEEALHQANVTATNTTITETGETVAYQNFVTNLPQMAAVSVKE